jgi:hypothetical protein
LNTEKRRRPLVVRFHDRARDAETSR